jgi:hypothetical protein
MEGGFNTHSPVQMLHIGCEVYEFNCTVRAVELSLIIT